MDELKQIKDKMLVEQVRDHIFQLILKTPIPIGGKLPNEFSLSETFHVSRSTIREAVQQLVSLGILAVRRGSGTYVINTIPANQDPLGLRKIEDKVALAMDLADVRMMLEPEIAEMAARRAQEEDIRCLRAACLAAEQKILAGEDYGEEDVQFHTQIARCSPNKVMEHLVPLLDTAVVVFINVTHKKLLQETISTHRAIVDAIADHDCVGARAAVLMHLTLNRNEIKEVQKQSRASEVV